MSRWILGILTLKTDSISLSTRPSNASLGVSRCRGGISSIGSRAGEAAGEEVVEDTVMGESADMVRMVVGILVRLKARLNAIQSDPNSLSRLPAPSACPPPH